MEIKTMDLISIISALISIILGVVAIWLSIVFYKWSNTVSESTKEAAKDIGASVERLEKLFDRLYSDTFSMMKDTVSDMRKHIWPEQITQDKALAETDKKVEEKLQTVKDEMSLEIAALLQKQRIADDRLKNLSTDMQDLFERAIIKARTTESEVREESLKSFITRRIRHLALKNQPATADYIVASLGDNFPSSVIIRELETMKADGILHWQGALQPDTHIMYRRQ
jgi:hypothetical protein